MGPIEDDFDFEAWRTLYETDPLAFEEKRLALINRTIDAAPLEHQRRLRGLMFEVEARRLKAKTPMESCIAISSMMWDKFEELRVQLNHLADPNALDQLRSDEAAQAPQKAKVLSFQKR